MKKQMQGLSWMISGKSSDVGQLTRFCWLFQGLTLKPTNLVELLIYVCVYNLHSVLLCQQRCLVSCFVWCRPLGALNYLRIWHDNSGKGKFGGWHLNFVVVRDVQTKHRYHFVVNQWLAVEEDDGQVAYACYCRCCITLAVHCCNAPAKGCTVVVVVSVDLYSALS